MTPSLILRTATRLLIPVMLLFSAHLLVEGHHSPGGGFAGGLLAAGAFSLYAIAYGIREARRGLPVHPLTLLGIGLALAVASGLLPLLAGKAFLEGMWGAPTRLLGLQLELGTPLVFDLGVYFIVVGTSLTAIFELEDTFDEDDPNPTPPN